MNPSEFVGARPQVAWFANEMERQLQANDHKTGWGHLSNKQLLSMLRKEVAELERALVEPRGRNVVEEAADLANFAMMLAYKFMEADNG